MTVSIRSSASLIGFREFDRIPRTQSETVDRGDRIGAILFDDEEFVEIKPQRSRGNVLRICHELVRLNGRLSATRQSGGSATLNDALRRAVNMAKHDYLVILITDYHGDDETTRELTTQLAAHNDVLAVLIYDPLGAQLSGQGQMEATDGRGRASIPVGDQFAKRFAAEFQARCDQIRQRLRAVRIPLLPICTHDPLPEQVMAALGRGR